MSPPLEEGWLRSSRGGRSRRNMVSLLTTPSAPVGRVHPPQEEGTASYFFFTSAAGALHAQFAASFRSPLPLYSAACGYGHSGRVSVPALFFPIIVSGATPFSTH